MRNPTMVGSPRTWALLGHYLDSTWALLGHYSRTVCALLFWEYLGILGDCLVTTQPLLGDCLVIGATWWPLWENNWEHSLTIGRAYFPLYVFVCVYLYLYVQEGGTVPPPFNIIPTPKSLFYVLAWLRRNCFSKACIFCISTMLFILRYLTKYTKQVGKSKEQPLKSIRVGDPILDRFSI